MEDLKNYFRETPEAAVDDKFKDIQFVGNRENFLKAEAEKGYDQVYSDRFRQTWGHTTPYGHSLIVESLLPTVISEIRKIQNQTKN